MIFFRYRRSGDTIDSSYFLVDRAKVTKPDHLLVGDEVIVWFDMPAGMREAVKESCRFRPFDVSGKTIMVPCTVARRRHTLEWIATGNLLQMDMNVYLEAISADWEDVLLWVIKGVVPAWAEGE